MASADWPAHNRTVRAAQGDFNEDNVTSSFGLPNLPDLSDELKRLLAQVPRGRVTSFGDLAEALGDLGAARWVATEIAGWRDTKLPWHRAVRRTGDLAAGTDDERQRQSELLKGEGVDLERVPRWTGFASSRPLRTLAEWQSATARLATFDESVPLPERVGAVDLSYASDSKAVAAYVACDSKTLEIVDRESVRVPVPFPYIPGYLTFRELPALLELVGRVDNRIAPIVLVDGSGRLHPRRFGIAVALGVLAGLRTVGVSKHRLCGRPRGETASDEVPLWDGDEQLGYRLDGGSKRRTMYVSPGCGINAASAVRIVRSVWKDRRSPEPIHWADALSRAEVKGNPG